MRMVPGLPSRPQPVKNCQLVSKRCLPAGQLDDRSSFRLQKLHRTDRLHRDWSGSKHNARNSPLHGAGRIRYNDFRISAHLAATDAERNPDFVVSAVVAVAIIVELISGYAKLPVSVEVQFPTPTLSLPLPLLGVTTVAVPLELKDNMIGKVLPPTPLSNPGGSVTTPIQEPLNPVELVCP